MSGAPNHRPVDGYGGGFVRPDPVRDLAAYDALPRPARRALDEAPLAISASAALEYYRKHGIMALMAEIQASADEYYAACEAETGVPRPAGPLVAKPHRRKRWTSIRSECGRMNKLVKQALIP